MANDCSHLKALLKKNFILFKRSCCGSCCEMLTPIVFVLFLTAVRGLVSTENVEKISYVGKGVEFQSNPFIDSNAFNQIAGLPKDNPQRSLFVNRMILANNIKNCITSKNRKGMIALSPRNFITEGLAENFKKFPEEAFPYKFFDSMEAMDSYIKADNYGSISYPNICFGVSVTQANSRSYEYHIRYNNTGNQDDVYDTLDIIPRTVQFVKESFTNSDKFLDSGFLTVQNWIDNIILRQESGNPNIQINPTLTSVSVIAHVSDNIALYLQGQTNVFLVLPLILPYLRLIFRLLYEKEKKIREGMKMMGMTNMSFYTSWIITYLIIYLIICVVNAIILTGGVFKHSNGFFIFLMLYIFCIVLIFQSLFISVFFTRVKSGIIAGIIFFFALYIINSLIALNEVSFDTKRKASLSSHAAMAFAAETILVLETNQLGIDSSTMRSIVNNYNFETFFGFEFLNIIIFSILSIYLDQVFPNEFGQKKHPLFFIRWIWMRKANNLHKVKNEDLEMQDLNEFKDVVEPVDAALRQQENENQAIIIDKLNKIYPNGKHAVSNLCLNMYQNQIFVLLGHNGAGKTTTISMLTGMLSPSSGSASIFGLDITQDMETLRTTMGVCPQHDILFDTLTVKEHLYLFATFKGMDSKSIPAEVQKIIDDVDLGAKQNDLAKNLSGGQKRRLSVGIAFIGNSKLILLDEPTSGMDTSARRYIWNMLKDYKNNRIVLLTTHFMDEADFLGDRIAIMGDGELRCCGSSVFLKTKFGVGYNLILVKKNTESNQKIHDFIRSYVPEAICLSDIAAEITFQLPLASIGKFNQLFTNLDINLETLQVSSYGISITTLEEVFLKVAEGLEKQKVKEEVNLLKKKRTDEYEKIDDFDLNSVKIKGKVALYFTHLWALILKRINYFKRDKKGLCCEIFMPMCIAGFGLCITLIDFSMTGKPEIMNPSILNTPIYLPVQNNYLQFYQNSNFFRTEYFKYLPDTSGESNFNKLSFDNFIFNNRNKSLYGGLYADQIEDTNFLKYIAFYNSTTPFSLPILMNTMNQALISRAVNNRVDIRIYNSPLPQTKQFEKLAATALGFIASFIFSIAMAFIPASLVVFLVKEREQGVKHQQLVSGVSVFSYWTANLFVDILKLALPTIFCVLMCLAFNIKGLIDPSQSFGATWILFIFFALSLIPFTYLVSFLFKDYGNAQAFIFVFFFLASAVLSLIIFVLRLVPSSREGAKIAQYFLRLLPPFCFGYGILNIANRDLYALLEKYYVAKDALDSDIALWDVVYMAIESVVYFLLVFVVEKVSKMPKILRMFTHENSIPYEAIEYDEDVLQEMKKIENSSPSDYSVYTKDLRKVFVLGDNRHKVAVTKSSFGVVNGDCFGLLGVNGAGKTTTFKMLCGEIVPTSGMACVNGFDLSQDLERARENIGYCPQFDALLENLTAKEHLFLYAAIKGIPYKMRRQLVQKKLEEMNLKEYENVCSGTYSGGNKRKLSVAIAMLGNPPIVFLDEPSTGMDPKARRFMWDVINRISTLRKQSSVILTTHSMEEAEALSTKMCIMVNGTMKCLGSVQHIKSKYGKGYEVEVKTTIPTTHEIEEQIHNLGFSRGQKIHKSELESILQKLNKTNLLSKFAPSASGAHLLIEINKTLGLSVELLLEFIVVEEFGDRIMDFIQKNLGDFSVIEHFQSFYRFKVESNISIGKLFGFFEDNKNGLNIAQYSIKQASIEQIFNMFALEGDNEFNGLAPKNEKTEQNSSNGQKPRISSGLELERSNDENKGKQTPNNLPAPHRDFVQENI